MKTFYILSVLMLLAAFYAQAQNTFPSTGDVGIGTTTPDERLHISTGGHAVIRLDKGNGYTGGIDLFKAGTLLFNIYSGYSGSSDGDALKIKAPGLSAETDAAPRMHFPASNTNIFMAQSGGNVGIGTNSAPSKLTVSSAGHTFVQINKANGYEGGIDLTKGGTDLFYIFSDNSDSDALKIEAAGLTGESDATPRMQFPFANKNIYMAQSGGYVGIGTAQPDAKLTVNGTVHSTRVKVETTVPGPDYVFAETYHLPTLDEVKSYIDENKHLPEVPSAKEMEVKGIDVGEMNMLLLKKVEELTLYILAQEERIKALENKK